MTITYEEIQAQLKSDKEEFAKLPKWVQEPLLHETEIARGREMTTNETIEITQADKDAGMVLLAENWTKKPIDEVFATAFAKHRLSSVAEKDAGGTGFFSELRTVNEARNLEWAKGEKTDTLFHAVELAEEVGEVVGAVKKLYRQEKDWRGSKVSIDNLRDEIGDAMICLDHVARCFEIDIAEATISKFNKTSEKHNFNHRIGTRKTCEKDAEIERLRKALMQIVDMGGGFLGAGECRMVAMAAILNKQPTHQNGD